MSGALTHEHGRFAAGDLETSTDASSGEADPSHQILEAGVRAQRIEPWLDTKVLQLDIPRSIRVFERRERLFSLAERGQQNRQFGW